MPRFSECFSFHVLGVSSHTTKSKQVTIADSSCHPITSGFPRDQSTSSRNDRCRRQDPAVGSRCTYWSCGDEAHLHVRASPCGILQAQTRMQLPPRDVMSTEYSKGSNALVSNTQGACVQRKPAQVHGLRVLHAELRRGRRARSRLPIIPPRTTRSGIDSCACDAQLSSTPGPMAGLGRRGGRICAHAVPHDAAAGGENGCHVYQT